MDKLEKLCIKWLNDNYNHLELFYMEKYPDYIFHMKNGKCILQHNIKNGYVYVSYRQIWKFFENFFCMTNQQIKDITKIWVDEHYKIDSEIKKCVFTDGEQLAEEQYRKITTTKGEVFWLDKKVEEDYKNEVTTEKGFTLFLKVEEHYKKSVTINELDSIIANRIEEQYKDIQTTNDQSHFYFERDVEELYNQHTNG